MPTLRNIEIKLFENALPSTTKKLDSTFVSSLEVGVPKSPSKNQKKTPAAVLGLLNLSPKVGRKEKDSKRVTASPGDLSLRKLPSTDTANSSKKRKTTLEQALESSVGDYDNAGDENISLSTQGQKRKAEGYHSDIENNGDSSNERKQCITIEPPLTVASKPIVVDLLYSEEESSGDDDSMAQGSQTHTVTRNIAKPRNRRTSSTSASESGHVGWLTSFHATKSNDWSSPSGEYDEDEFERKLNRCNWLTSPSRYDKLDFLSTIENDNDKLLQMLLWDIGCDYKLHKHQFQAVRFVAGFVPSFPCEMKKQAGADSDSDESDGEDRAVQEMLQLDEIGRFARTNALRRKELMLLDRGMLLADEMSLGKTIEALAGAALRNAMKGRKKPTLIITPQDGVQQQWISSMRMSGVESARIGVMGESQTDTTKRGGKVNKKATLHSFDFVICTRYKIQSEMKTLFDYNTTAQLQGNTKASFLFSKVPLTLIKKLRHEYNVDKGKEKRTHHTRKEAPEDRVTRLIRESFGGKSSLMHVFETVVIDECHFLRNVLAYWGIGAALLGAQAKRTVLLSGTPYNNGPKDMSALMTFIDPRHEAARFKWWENATSKRKRNYIVQAVSAWKETFMLRRTKDALQVPLPRRERIQVDVPVKPSELGIYEAYEAMFLNVLNHFQEEIDDNNRKAQIELFDIMMACMSCMRMSLIHPILPGGREVTIQFSPSRRHLLNREENKEKCVFCGDNYPTQRAEIYAAKKTGELKEENGVDDFQQLLGMATRARSDDNIMDGDDEEMGRRKAVEMDKEKGPLVELGTDICHAAGSDCCHFAHERCIELFREKECQGGCPRCYDLTSRIHIGESAGLADKKIYCKEVGTTVSDLKGFTVSAKIDKAIKWFLQVPKDDKAIILSFFKGSLDLIEGILTDFGETCCRYDGDIAKEKRSTDLQRFKTNKGCRVLLASVQSGGTGLNITEANNVCFLDRWFNPQIHDQAESRCHRIGQKKTVKVAYLDTNFTVDVVMKHVNTLKEKNAEIVLADGTSLGYHSSLDYSNLAGVIGNALKRMIMMRLAVITGNGASGNADAPLLSSDDSDLDSKLYEATVAARATRKDMVKTEKYSNNDCSFARHFDDNSRYNGDTTSPMKSDEKGSESPSSNSDGSSSSDDKLLNREPAFGVKSEREANRTTNSKSKEVSTRNCKMLPSNSALNGERMSPVGSDSNGHVPPLSNSSNSLSSGDELLNRKPIFSVKSKRKTTGSITTKKSSYKISPRKLMFSCETISPKFGRNKNAPIPPNDNDSLSSDGNLINHEPTVFIESKRNDTAVTNNKSTEGRAWKNGNAPYSSHPVGIIIDLSYSDKEDEELPNSGKSQRKILNPIVNNKANVREEDDGTSHAWIGKSERPTKSGTSNISSLKGRCFSSEVAGRENPDRVTAKSFQ